MEATTILTRGGDHPALVERHHKALAARRQAELVTDEHLGDVFRKRDALNECRVRDRASQQRPATECSMQKIA